MLNDAIDLESLRRVLVIKLRHHGDVLLTSPVFTVLKNHAPHLELDALVYRDTAEMLTLHPAIRTVHTVDRGWKALGPLAQYRAEKALLDTLRDPGYDLVIQLTEHNRGAWLKRLTGARYGVARELGGKKKFWRKSFTHLYPFPRGNSRHTVETHLDALRRIGLQPAPEERRLTLVPGPEAEAAVDGLLQAHGLAGRPFIHLHPTSRWQFKCWPLEHFTTLVQALGRAGHALVITTGPAAEETAWGAALAAAATGPVADLSGQLSLKSLAALTARARLFIGVDSAPMHIAAAMQTPTVALFGPSGDVEWGPWMVPHRLLVSAHPCRPCGNDGCGGGKVSECLTVIEPERVLAAAQDLLAAP